MVVKRIRPGRCRSFGGGGMGVVCRERREETRDDERGRGSGGIPFAASEQVRGHGHGELPHGFAAARVDAAVTVRLCRDRALTAACVTLAATTLTVEANRAALRGCLRRGDATSRCVCPADAGAPSISATSSSSGGSHRGRLYVTPAPNSLSAEWIRAPRMRWRRAR